MVDPNVLKKRVKKGEEDDNKILTTFIKKEFKRKVEKDFDSELEELIDRIECRCNSNEDTVFDFFKKMDYIDLEELVKIFIIKEQFELNNYEIGNTDRIIGIENIIKNALNNTELKVIEKIEEEIDEYTCNFTDPEITTDKWLDRYDDEIAEYRRSLDKIDD